MQAQADSQSPLVDALNAAALTAEFASEGPILAGALNCCIIPLLRGEHGLYTPLKRDMHKRWPTGARTEYDVQIMARHLPLSGIALGIEPGGVLAVCCAADRSPFENAPHYDEPSTLTIRNADGTVTFIFKESDLPRLPKLADGFTFVEEWQALPPTPSFEWITSPSTCAVLPRLPLHLIKG